MILAVAQSVSQYRYGSGDAFPVFTSSHSTGLVHWSVNAGFLNHATGAVVELSPLNRSQVVTITATDDLNTVTKTIRIWATFPVQPKWQIEIDVDATTGKIQFPMVYEKRTFEEYFYDVLQFFKWHKKAIIEESEAEDGTLKYRVLAGRPFYVDDFASGIFALVYFDSVMRQSFEASNNTAYSFQFKGYDYVIPDLPVTGPFAVFAFLLQTGEPLLLQTSSQFLLAS
jgi:hypothetical protein